MSLFFYIVKLQLRKKQKGDIIMNNSILENENELQLDEAVSGYTSDELTLGMKKYPVVIQYLPQQKNILKSKLVQLGCDPIYELTFAECLVTDVNMEQVEEIKSYSCVVSIERDYDYNLQTVSEEEDESSANASEYAYDCLKELHMQGITGQGIKVAVFDTGSAGSCCECCNEQVSFVTYDGTADVDNNHGVNMEGIISRCANNTQVGVAPEANVYSVNVVNNNGFVTTSSLMKAINWAIANDINIISMSFGCYYPSHQLYRMLKRATQYGIIVVAAAGNDGGFEDDKPAMYPAAFSNVLAIGAGGMDGTSHFSNRCLLDFVAPGTISTVDKCGRKEVIVGTSAACAYSAGLLALLWSAAENRTASDIVVAAKQTGAVGEDLTDNIGYGAIDVMSALTFLNDNDTLSFGEEDILTYGSSNIATETISQQTASASASIQDGLSRATAFELTLNKAFYNNILCPGGETWFKFKANSANAHPNGDLGWYSIYSISEFDTIGYLYDSYGNFMCWNDTSGLVLGNYHIYERLEKNETYYLKVEAKGNNYGLLQTYVKPKADDCGSTLDTAKFVNVNEKDQVLTGRLDYSNDIDYYKFTPESDCVMEIYTEGEADTFGRLYDSCGTCLESNDNGNGNHHFKIRRHFSKGATYYISVERDSSGSSGDYSVNFKFVKNYSNDIVDEQYKVVTWLNRDENAYPGLNESVTKSVVYIGNHAKGEYLLRIIKNTFKSELQDALLQQNLEAVADFLIAYVLSKIPVIGDYLGFAYELGSALYGYMDSLDEAFYLECCRQTENTNKYIVGTYFMHMSPRPGALINYTNYSTASGSYEGPLFERGNFVELDLKAN